VTNHNPATDINCICVEITRNQWDNSRGKNSGKEVFSESYGGAVWTAEKQRNIQAGSSAFSFQQLDGWYSHNHWLICFFN
jgi:hypothetical protein